MSYQIIPIKFKSSVPSIDDIKLHLVNASDVNICLESKELEDQYYLYLEYKPEEILEFDIKKEQIVIVGDAANAPGLSKVFYSILVNMGGEPLPTLEVLKLPISRNDIEAIDSETRKQLRKLGLVIWVYIVAVIALIIALITLIINWLL